MGLAGGVVRSSSDISKLGIGPAFTNFSSRDDADLVAFHY